MTMAMIRYINCKKSLLTEGFCYLYNLYKHTIMTETRVTSWWNVTKVGKFSIISTQEVTGKTPGL